MSEPLIDICIPTWNCNPAYFKQAIDSALAQTETRWQIYIHDDASTSDMEAMVKPYLSDSRISWHPNNKKLGIGGNWNATMNLGTAPYVQFLFPDDWWDPWFLERGLKAMEEHPNVGVVSLGHTYVSENAADLGGYKELEAFRTSEFSPGLHDGKETLRYWLKRQLHPNIVGEPDFVMMRRSVLEKVGPYLEDMPQNLDTEMSMRILLESDWFCVPENCGYFRVHDDAISAINQREGKGIFDRFRCFEELLKHVERGPDYDLVIQSRNKALADMAKKFLQRLKGGKNVSVKGGGAFKKFALQHPVLVARAIGTVLFNGNR